MTHHDRLITATADLGRLNADELEAVAYLVAKLLAGSKKHGPLHLAVDRRDWPSEMLEEYADALFYAAFASVQRTRRTAPLADLAGLAAREAARDENTWRGYTGPGASGPAPSVDASADRETNYWMRMSAIAAGVDPDHSLDVPVTSDAYWQRHPIGSPERVQAVEEHRAALAANHAEEG